MTTDRTNAKRQRRYMRRLKSLATNQIRALRAENARLKARIAELEAGQHGLPTIEVGTHQPAPLQMTQDVVSPGEKAWRRKTQMRHAVRDAERKVADDWWKKGIARTKIPLDEKCRQLDAARNRRRV